LNILLAIHEPGLNLLETAMNAEAYSSIGVWTFSENNAGDGGHSMGERDCQLHRVLNTRRKTQRIPSQRGFACRSTLLGSLALLLGGIALSLSAQTPESNPPPVSLDGYDFDGDGQDDLLAALGGFDPTTPIVGRIDVFAGGSFNLIRSLQSGVGNDLFGYSYSTAGDLNGDGFNDIIVGAPLTTIDGEHAGRAYVYSGADGSELITLTGDPDSYFGRAVAAAGDVNGDGSLDVLVASTRIVDDGTSVEAFNTVYAFDGTTGSLFREFASPIPNDRFGTAIVAIGDLDGDGAEEIAISDPDAPGVGDALGSAYVFYGGVEPDVPDIVDIFAADIVLHNSDTTLSEYGSYLLPSVDNATGDIDGLMVFSTSADAATAPLILSIVGLDGVVSGVHPFAEVFPIGDTNATQTVDTADIGQILQDYGQDAQPLSPFGSDINGDGIVETSDVSIALGGLGEVGVLEDLVPPGAAFAAAGSLQNNSGCCGTIPWGHADHSGQPLPICVMRDDCEGEPENEDDNPSGFDDLDDGGGGGPNGGGGPGPGGNDDPPDDNPGGDGDDPPCAAVILGCPDEPVALVCEVEAPPTVVWLNAGAGDVGFTYFWTLPAGVHFAEGTDAFDSWIAVAVDAPGEHYISVLIQFPTLAECTAVCVFEAILPCVDLIAYRPLTEYFDYTRYKIPDSEELDPGVGVRMNALANLNNRVRPDVSLLTRIDMVMATTNIELVEYVLVRSDPGIEVWQGATAVFGASDEAVIEAFGGIPELGWIEVTDRMVDHTLTLESRLIATGAVVESDTLNVFAFESIVVVIGGLDQEPSVPADSNHGIFSMGIELYEEGYNVHLYNESAVSAVDGSGVAYTETVAAIQDNTIMTVAIVGYSHGGGSAVGLAARLDANRGTIGPYILGYSAFIDAVAEQTMNQLGQENRRPAGATVFINYYQENGAFEIGGGPVTGLQPQDLEINVTQTAWGFSLNHFDIDDHSNVLLGIKMGMLSNIPDR
jgi:hypothetical protein